MTINNITFQTEQPSPNNKFSILQGAQALSVGVAAFAGIKLIDSAALNIYEIFFPELLNPDERLDLEQANLEWEIAEMRADTIDPVKVFQDTFLLLMYLSKLARLCKVTGVNRALKEKLISIKEDLMGLFRKQPNNPQQFENFRILDQIEEYTQQMEREITTTKDANVIEITTATLDMASLVTPYAPITSIVEVGKIFSDLNKPVENQSILSVSEKIFKIAGRTGKAVAGFTPFPTIGKFFSNAVITTGSLLGIVDRENAA